jgi:hypothetical protein
MVISKIWKWGESTNGVIQVSVEHRKEGFLGRKMSIGACLIFWKHEMHCKYENWSGNFLYLPYRNAPYEI